MALRVCQLCAVDFTLAHFLLPLIDGMRNEGWKVTAVCSDGPMINELRKKNYEIETINVERSFNIYRHIKTIIALIRLFRARRFDVVHVHTPVAALIGRVAAKISGVPLIIYTAHGFYFHDDMPAWKRRVYIWLEKSAGRFTDLIFTQSEEDAKTAITEKIIVSDRVLVIANGVDTNRFSPDAVKSRTDLRLSLGIPEEAYVIGFIGRLVKEKGVEEFLIAAKQVAKENLKVWFLLTGDRLISDHSSGIEYELRQTKEALAERLVITGLRSDIPEMLMIMDLFCLPSWREGMPRTIIEAMMMGRPVLATNIRGSREEVVHGETGYLVPPKSSVDLASAMTLFIKNPEWGRDLGAAGRQRALRFYDEQNVISIQIKRIKNELRKREAIV